MQLNARRSMILVTVILVGFFVVSFLFLNLQEQPLTIPIKSSSNPSQIATEAALATTSATPSAILQPSMEASLALANSTPSSLPLTLPNSAAGPAVEITNFKRSENKDGKLAWELAGSSARYELGGAEIQIMDADIKTRLSNGTLATLKTPLAKIAMNGATLDTARGSGGVDITLDSGVTVSTRSAVFERSTGKISTPELITIHHPQGSLTADKFEGDTTRGYFVFTGNIQTTILPEDKGNR